MLQACLNGGRDKGFHAVTPLTPGELAADARAVVDAGARELHIHPRDAAGRESLGPDDTARALEAIRASVPGIPVGLSTGWWIAPQGRARQQQIRAWQVLPDYVSVNLIEEDATEIIDLALAKGIGVEAGLWSAADAERFVSIANARNCLRVLIEINEQEFSAGAAAARQIMGILDRAEIHLPRLLHGLENTMWRFYREALRLQLDARIGFEDGKLLPSGAEAENNAALIGAAQVLLRQGRATLSP
jgi:uncharacterized protein (DUF849 family)